MDILNKIEWLIDLAKEEIDRPLSVRKAAEYLDVSRSFIYKMIHKKQIPFSKVNNRLIYFDKKDLKLFALGNKIKVNVNKK